MATNGTPPPTPNFDNTDLMNYVVRMVTPMRREFSRSLDVSHFLHDFAYAKEIIDQAKSSKDARLCEYALYLEAKLIGPRNSGIAPQGRSASPATVASAATPEPQASAATPTKPSTEPTEAEMRARMMSKYKSGLR